ncbi:MAG: hypothetical protein JNJ48_03105 [Phycisphaerae bacterium]|nr:hypothetical protein [Phycisphaerae bacterium]
MDRRRTVAPVAGLLGALTGASAMAADNPFTETFGTGAAWRDGGGVNAPFLAPTGGPDGSSYVTTMLSFFSYGPGENPQLFRAELPYGSSGGALFGDWIGAGITSFSFWFRAATPGPITVFARFAPALGPGVVAVVGQAAPGAWTQFTVAINPGAPLIYEGTNFSVFGSIGRVQIGVIVPAGLAGSNVPFTFDLDSVAVVPSPAGAALAGLGLLAATRRRRA